MTTREGLRTGLPGATPLHMKPRTPESFFLVVILLAGVLAVLVTPFGAGFDEETHIARIWEMSAGVLVPNRLLSRGDYYPRVFYELSYRQYKNLTPVSRDMWARQLQAKIDWGEMMSYETRSHVFPLVYAPHALVMATLARGLHAPVGLTYYLLRLATLTTYAVLVFLAIRLIPVGKWLITVFALSPTMIVLASTVSTDAANMAAALLFLAWIMRLACRPTTALTRRELVATLGLVFVVCSLKPTTACVVGLLVLLPRGSFASRKHAAIFLALLAIVMGSVLFGWMLGVSFGASSVGQVAPLDQLQVVLHDPAHFAHLVWANFQTEGLRYIEEAIGVSGYGYWTMPTFVYWVYPVLLGVAVLRERAEGFLAPRRRMILIAVSLAHSLAVVVALYLTFTPVGAGELLGLQGRYFLPGLPLVALALAPRRPLFAGGAAMLRIGTALLALVTVLVLAIVYHIPCGDSYYTRGLCYLPVYKNWDPAASAALPVSGDHRITQDFTSVCKNLTELRLWIASSSASPTDGVAVEVTQADSGIPLASRTFGAADLVPGSWLRLAFPPWPDSDHRRILVSIGPTQEVSQQSIALGWTETDEYFEGRATLDGNDLHGDLMFQYGCRVGLDALLGR